MRFETSDHEHDAQRLLPSGVAEGLSLWLKRVNGLVTLALIGALWAALISWSNADPSLTHVTREAPRNLLGYPGAIVSDLMLQTLGLTAILVLLAPTLWAGETLLTGQVSRLRQKLIFLPVSVTVLAGALSALPQASVWPLDPGYGGILGDGVYRFAFATAAVIAADKAGLLAGVILFAAGFAALAHAIGVEIKDLGAALVRPPSALPIEPYVPRDPDEAEVDPSEERHFEPRLSMPEGLSPAGSEPAVRVQASRLAGAFARHGAQAPPMPRWQPPPEPLDALVSDNHADPAAAHDAGPKSATAPQWTADLPAWAGSVDDPDDEDLDALDADNAADSKEMARRFAPGGGAADKRQARSARGSSSARSSRQSHTAQVGEMQMNSVPRARGSTAQSAGPAGAGGSDSAQEKKPSRARSPLIDGMTFAASEHAYRRPSLNLLRSSAPGLPGPELTQQVLRGSARLLEDVLADFGIKGEIKDIRPGPVITLYEFEPARGTKISRVIGLADDIARAMSTTAVRVAVVPGRSVIGIEIPNMRREPVVLRELLETEAYRSAEGVLPLAIGKAIGGESVVTDLVRMPHLLVAGTTGSGKSVGINAMILSLIYRHGPETCRLVMIDPKMLELSAYNGIPHLLAPVVTDPQKAVAALEWVVAEMDERYKQMAKLSVRNIDIFNNRVRNAKKRGEMIARVVQTGFDRRTGLAIYEHEQMDFDAMAYIVVVIDELADLMMTAGKEVETAIQRLSQKARAAGIHLVVATQRPSVDVVTGTIKANFPTRISFRVASKIDSRTILGEQGAEQLLGQGDMLHQTGAGQVTRVHGAFVADEEVEAITEFLRASPGPGYADDLVKAIERVDAADPAEDEAQAGPDIEALYLKAVEMVLADRKPSVSYVQRRLGIGYNRAADLIERMERDGVVGPANANGRREIVATGMVRARAANDG